MGRGFCFWHICVLSFGLLLFFSSSSVLGFFFIFSFGISLDWGFFRCCISKGVCGRDVINAWDDIKSFFFFLLFWSEGLKGTFLVCLLAFSFLPFGFSSYLLGTKYHHCLLQREKSAPFPSVMKTFCRTG
jgi:hypothetical protein